MYSTGFVADGHERARAGIRAQVAAEFAEQLKKATPEEAARLRQQMQREVDSRMRHAAPADALY
jgi:hypothetical protein